MFELPPRPEYFGPEHEAQRGIDRQVERPIDPVGAGGGVEGVAVDSLDGEMAEPEDTQR